MDLTSRLRSIVRSGAERAVRELTYEPDDGYRNPAVCDPDAVASALGGRRMPTKFGECLIIDRRYESDRWHGGIQVGDCELTDCESLALLDPGLEVVRSAKCEPRTANARIPRTIFIDLETTGLSGGAGTIAFLVGCAYFDLGAFQVRQFLLTSYSGERALLAAVGDFFEDAELIVTYNGKTFDVPVMETRWMFHRMTMPLESVPHFDMLHPARRLWRHDEQGCRLSTLERMLFDVRRVGDVPGLEVPSRFFRFVRSGDPRPLEPVLEHNRIDLVSLAAVTARAVRLTREGHDACRDSGEALALGKVFERAEQHSRAEECYRRATESPDPPTRAEAFYRLAVRLRRDRRYADAAGVWRELVEMTESRAMRRGTPGELRQVAIEALAIHHEHRARDLVGAREFARSALEESTGRDVDAVRHRLARLDRKLYKNKDAQLFPS